MEGSSIMIRRRIKLVAATATLALGIGLLGAGPAMANTISGSIGCGTGYRPWIETVSLPGSGVTSHKWNPGADSSWSTTGHHTSSPGIAYKASSYTATATYIYLDSSGCAQNPGG